uniref:Uncharacterized protein n=1 Tax=Panagrolaimus davidi TaxID=227884 RepID=A0A914PMN5_9BILA
MNKLTVLGRIPLYRLTSSYVNAISLRNFSTATPTFVRNTVINFVPQQEAWVSERMGKFHKVLEPKHSFDATLEWSFDRPGFDILDNTLEEIDRDVQIDIDTKNGDFAIYRNDFSGIQADMDKYRFVRHKEFITLLDKDRCHFASLIFRNESVAKEVIKLVWKYKCGKSGSNEFENIPPSTIQHSNHDSAAVFNYEDKNKVVQFFTSNQNESVQSCTIFIDVEKEVIVVKPPKKAKPVELPFSQLSSTKSKVLIFKLDNGQKFKLYFSEDKIATKVYGIINDKKKAIKAEEATLEMVLKKLNDDPNSLEEVKELIKYYVKIFTIFKEEKYQDKIYELYQILNGFHETFYYPNFEFRSDNNGIPKGKLIIFATKDKKECYEFSFDSKGYKCSKCTGKSTVTAKYCINGYGERFIKTNGKHVCKPVKYQSEKNVANKFPLFEFLNDPTENWFHDDKMLHVLNPSKTALYVYKRLKEDNMETHLWYCKGCKHLGKYVYAIPTNDDKSLEILDEDHICSPERFRAPEIIKENVDSEDDEK